MLEVKIINATSNEGVFINYPQLTENEASVAVGGSIINNRPVSEMAGSLPR